MPQYGFGLGVLSLTDTTDSATTRKTPVVCGVLQDVTLEIAMQSKELRGAFQFPVDVARAGGSVQGKARFAQLGIGTIAAILGVTPTAAMKLASINEEITVNQSGTGFTLDPPGNGIFYENISVFNRNTGLLMTRVNDGTAQGTLTTGQYTCNPSTGQYQVSSSDTSGASLPLYVTYTYTENTLGKTATLNNLLMGAGPTFKLDLHNNFRSKHVGWRLPAVTLPKLGFGPKLDDYTTIDIDFIAFADQSGKVLDSYFTE